MNDELFRNDPDIELSPEESAAIDRIMARAAELENGEVDYARILKGVKARAKAEGIVIFPSAAAKKRRALVKRIAMGAATAAAVFVFGLAAMAVVKSIAPAGGNSPAANVDAANDFKGDVGDNVIETSAIAETRQPSESATKHTQAPNNDTAPNPSIQPVSTVSPYEPTATTPPEESPFPSEYPMRGGSVGYIALDVFEKDPDTAEDLIPEDLPEGMKIGCIDDLSLNAFVTGIIEGKDCCYSCRVIKDIDSDLSLGVAKYKLTDDLDKLSYLWRISETTYLEIEFSGFDKEQAEMLLESLAAENAYCVDPAA